MSNIKVSIEFLDGPDSGIIKKSARIVKSMTNNPIFKSGPVSPQGIQAAADHLDAMCRKAKKGGKRNIENRAEARGDADDYIRQTADFINHCSLQKEELETTGFDLIEVARKKPKGVPQAFA
ncbi:MAG TPA: hypothetical protein VE978_28550 [Chitinophagales bacterium]|nr:hypothetical protein [Chitinophagales bacterium]